MHVAAPRRVAMLSVHTSPLDQPGTADAGGMNVYVTQTARRLAERGTEVEIFTRATSSDLPPCVELAPGVLLRHVVAGPFAGLTKQDLPAQLCAFAAGLMRAEARHDEGWYDLVHSHYWLSGHVGLTVSGRWHAPLVHTMHTMAKVKNASLGAGDVPEPAARVVGEQSLVDGAEMLLANTGTEARELMELYGAPADRLAVAVPGVDLDLFRPGPGLRSRAALGLPADAHVVLFVGRLQPLKRPDLVVRAVGDLAARRPDLRSRLVVAVVGGPSGNGLGSLDRLRELARAEGVADLLHLAPPAPAAVLADWYRAADVLLMPSQSESFGLVALEAQACGTPVVAARVGGLPSAVRDGETGLLLASRDPRRWSQAVETVLSSPALRRSMGRSGRRHAERHSWEATVDATLDAYRGALAAHRRDALHPVPALAG